jgi:hypothetical protein
MFLFVTLLHCVCFKLSIDLGKREIIKKEILKKLDSFIIWMRKEIRKEINTICNCQKNISLPLGEGFV